MPAGVRGQERERKPRKQTETVGERALTWGMYPGAEARSRLKKRVMLSTGADSLQWAGWRIMFQLLFWKSDVIILPFLDANSSNQAVKNILTLVCYCWPQANLVASQGFNSHIPIRNKLLEFRKCECQEVHFETHTGLSVGQRKEGGATSDPASLAKP